MKFGDGISPDGGNVIKHHSQCKLYIKVNMYLDLDCALSAVNASSQCY